MEIYGAFDRFSCPDIVVVCYIIADYYDWHGDDDRLLYNSENDGGSGRISDTNVL